MSGRGGGGRLEVLFTPADFNALPGRDLSGTTCIVFDVLRATTTLLTALEAGAESVVPVPDIASALEWRRRDPSVLLAGERDGRRILAAQTGGVDFDLGNSPREFTSGTVAGRRIVMTTTNGTRALHACAGAAAVLPACLRNIGAVARWCAAHRTPDWLVVCSGTYEEAAFEDVLGAGAMVDRLAPLLGDVELLDGAQVARAIYRGAAGDLAGAMGTMARNGRRLMSIPDLALDVAVCATVDDLGLVARMEGGERTVRVVR